MGGYIRGLGPLPALLADQERRALKGIPAPPRVDVAGGGKRGSS